MSVSVKSLEAELEGALHVKEQEAIIAEVHQWLSDGDSAGTRLTIDADFAALILHALAVREAVQNHSRARRPGCPLCGNGTLHRCLFLNLVCFFSCNNDTDSIVDSSADASGYSKTTVVCLLRPC